MPTINQLPVLNVVSPGDQLPVYSPNNGDARRTSIGSLLAFFQQSFASPTMAVNLFVPGSGFNLTVPTPVAEQQWMLLQPASTLATGTITLPLNTGVPDGTELLISSTQEITSFTIALNGASAVFGNVTTLAAGAAVRYRYYDPTNSWYNIVSDLSVSSGGDVNGPASSTDNAITRFDLTTGKLIQNSLVTIADNGAITSPNNTGSMIPFYYANLASFPVAADSHGALAHNHANGKMYYAHAGVWIELANMTDVATGISFSITNSGSSAFVFSGPGIVAGNTDNPILFLKKGFTYTFINNAGGGHPLEFRVSSGGAEYTSPALTGSKTGTQIYTVPFDAPATLFYQCTNHGAMGNTINIS